MIGVLAQANTSFHLTSEEDTEDRVAQAVDSLPCKSADATCFGERQEERRAGSRKTLSAYSTYTLLNGTSFSRSFGERPLAVGQLYLPRFSKQSQWRSVDKWCYQSAHLRVEV